MATTASSHVGACPRCGSALTEHDVLIEYRTDGRPAAYAACPDCSSVVDPLGR
jgi:hypothetical protein